MTYCLAITVGKGLIFCSDSRTNAGVDQVSTYSKMYRFLGDGERMVTILSAGNLATTQAVMRQVRRDLESGAERSLKSVDSLADAAEYVGGISVEQQRKHREATAGSFAPDASFILGGQVSGREPQIFQVYPEGNHIRATPETPYLQIGEIKYGKPILDRIIAADTPLEVAARCALVSMDSSMRSNITVGPPIEVLIYEAQSLAAGQYLLLKEDDTYLRDLRRIWQESLRNAFEGLPRLPVQPGQPSHVRLVDG
ncbi:MAG: peptidase [Chromatiales bacterium]|nr:peptidase [Chromatiales bacterium]